MKKYLTAAIDRWQNWDWVERGWALFVTFIVLACVSAIELPWTGYNPGPRTADQAPINYGPDYDDSYEGEWYDGDGSAGLDTNTSFNDNYDKNSDQYHGNPHKHNFPDGYPKPFTGKGQDFDVDGVEDANDWDMNNNGYIDPGTCCD